ncbi:tetratricopeptide (TPR) repeat protein [Bacillus sp. SORGH_AS 510]|uniref:tetratricopeptide repeat protein n=1 Tax=Bacillus sp. SORGH_AS_0510 TaxID=3041771 RepID=UPI002788AF1E|nr:tetratricopeptide repeat protein [Bacillus sp. SORGH_AS_0510]MDQ1144836.1 tetratricopeptide (TPR) repeat protein [Bacillus sp. SORGH_AS_0510]
MKKREQAKRKDNVIYFPGLEKRLTDKGLESLEKKKFKEAIALLEEARELDPNNDNTLIGLVLAYFEAGSFNNAKVLAKEMLHKGIGDYFQLVDLYLTVLIQLHEYHEIVSTVEALLEEREIPPEKHDHFLTILQFSRRMAENRQSAEEDVLTEDTNTKELQLLKIKDLNEQLLLISSLAEKNIRPYITEMADYLKDETGHPFLKTMLLTLLKEQEVDKEFVVNKFSKEETFHTGRLPEVRVQPKMNQVKELLEGQLLSNNPVLFEQTIGMVERIFFISYPFDLEPKSPAAWAAAFHLLAKNYLGMDGEIEEVADDYQVSSDEIILARANIEEIDKISYPNI